MKDEYYYWNGFGKKISPWLSRLGSLSAPFLGYPVFAYSNNIEQRSFYIKSKIAALVSDDYDPIDPIQAAIENGAEVSEPKRASVS